MRELLALTTIDKTTTGLGATGDAAFGTAWTGTQSATSLSYFIGNNIIQPIFALVGLGFFVLAVYAGVLWMTARGESKQVDKAKDILTSATIGLVIIVASYVLTNAILSAVTSSNGSIT
ncbi:MAG: hypothetical protein AAB473_04985 [Patescibacteria group bacterium]